MKASRFLLVSLTMDAILGQTTAYGRRRKLRTMVEGLDLKDIYGATMERIREQGGERARLGMGALMWITHSERLLQLDELLHALAVEIGSADLNAENIPSVDTLLSCCLGLVVVDGEASTVRLIHFTLQEYLSTSLDLFGPTHSIMAETCLTYLGFRTIEYISSASFLRYRSIPFLKYSSLYWGAHAKREASGGVVSLALQLFSQTETHVSTKLLLEDVNRWLGQYCRCIPVSGPLIGFTGLHCASFFGIAEIATFLISQPNCNLNKEDFLGITPLIWAAMCGQEEVTKLLLGRQTVDPDKPDGYFRQTALSWAAKMGHEGVVRLLLELASANPDGTDGWWGKTPRLVKMARGKRYVNPNWSGELGQTPIHLAASEGHEGVVKLLLGRKDVKPNMFDNGGRTPLSRAAWKGQNGAVELLLGREDINPNFPDNDDRTPLSWAAGGGRSGAVELLLVREDVNPNIPDKHGRTPLSWAARSGRHEAVKLLLEREDVNPNMPDKYGKTSLSWAASTWNSGGVKAAKLLLGREDVNPNIPDNDGRTPLSWAAGSGHHGAVELLLGREDVNPDVPDNSGRTPLSLAVTSWHGGGGGVKAAKLLLGREDVNPNMPDSDGRTPLSWAVCHERHGAVELLLGREGVNPDVPDKHGRTPLSWAAEDGRHGAVELLLRREGVDSGIPTKTA